MPPARSGIPELKHRQNRIREVAVKMGQLGEAKSWFAHRESLQASRPVLPQPTAARSEARLAVDLLVKLRPS